MKLIETKKLKNNNCKDCNNCKDYKERFYFNEVHLFNEVRIYTNIRSTNKFYCLLYFFTVH